MAWASQYSTKQYKFIKIGSTSHTILNSASFDPNEGEYGVDQLTLHNITWKTNVFNLYRLLEVDQGILDLAAKNELGTTEGVIYNEVNIVNSVLGYASGLISNTLTSTKLGSDVTYFFSNSKVFLNSVKYLKPIGFWTSSIGVGIDIIKSSDGSQTWTETGINTAVTSISVGVGGWPGLIIQADYQASKAYMNSISKHPDWVLPVRYHCFSH